jgi:phosphoribosyl-dephospho-CoA transferase
MLAAPARVDCQVDTPLGAVALAEMLSAAPRILIKATNGPRMVSAAELRR